LGQCINLLLVL